MHFLHQGLSRVKGKDQKGKNCLLTGFMWIETRSLNIIASENVTVDNKDVKTKS